MNAIWIFPEDINLTQWSREWRDLVEKFGYDRENPPAGILLAEIKTNQ